jgi:predicted nucleic acid-binding protein
VIAVDTNVLVYAVDRAAGERHVTAATLVDGLIRRQEILFLLQSFAEFFRATTRKRVLSAEASRAFVDGWWSVAPSAAYEAADLFAAMDAVNKHKLSPFDALIWATAERAGVTYFVTEDQQDGRRLGRVTFVDPFVARNRALLGLD